jgi:hypothetical protein
MAWRGREDFGERLQPLAEHDPQQDDHDAGSSRRRGPAPPSEDREARKDWKREKPVKREPEAEVCVVSRTPEVPVHVDCDTDPKRGKPESR